MAGRKHSRELKAQLLSELDAARIDLLAHGELAKEEFSPRALVSKSVAQHKMAWIIGSAVAGLVVLRVLFPPKIRSDNSAAPVRTGLLSRLFSTVSSLLMKRAATQLATHYLKDSASNYLSSIFTRHV